MKARLLYLLDEGFAPVQGKMLEEYLRESWGRGSQRQQTARRAHAIPKGTEGTEEKIIRRISKPRGRKPTDTATRPVTPFLFAQVPSLSCYKIHLSLAAARSGSDAFSPNHQLQQSMPLCSMSFCSIYKA